MTADLRIEGAFEKHLRKARDAGRKLLVPYVTGGLDERWIETLEAVASAGADAVEVGIPFSDPVMDGPIIQEASVRALGRATTPSSVLGELARSEVTIPVAVMTYANLIVHAGYRRMAESLASARVGAAIIPDLPIDEAAEWMRACEQAGIDAVQLVAPTTPPGRLERICAASHGFVYAIGLMGVTGERASVSTSALEIARRARAVTDLPVLVGVGVSNADQAVAISAESDGVVIGSALVRRLLEGGGPEAAGEFVAEIRDGLDRNFG